MLLQRNTLFFLYLFVLGLLSLSSCSHQYYAVDAGHSLRLQEKGDIKASGGIFSGGQVGYSPKEHIGVTAAYTNSRTNVIGNAFGGGFSTPVVNPYSRTRSVSGAVGYYHFLDRESGRAERPLQMREGVLFDVYGGYGRGWNQNVYQFGGVANIQFHKFYIQPGLHIQNRFFNISFMARYSRLQYLKGTILGDAGAQAFQETAEIEENPSFDLIESSIRLESGTKQIRGFFSLSFLTTANPSVVNFDGADAQMGVAIDIDDLFLKREKKEPKVSKDKPTKKKKKKKSKKKKKKRKKRK